MTGMAPDITTVPTAPGTVPPYTPHDTNQLSGGTSIGDGATSGDYANGGNSDEPIDRTALNNNVTETTKYPRPFGKMLNQVDRQQSRWGMRHTLSLLGRSDMSGMV